MPNHFDRTDSGYPAIDPGDLRHLITYLNQTTVNDSSGVSTAWLPSSPPVTSWAKIEVMSARDLIQGGQTTSQVIAVVTVRWEPGIEQNARFIDENSSTWIIQGVRNLEGRNVVLEMVCLGLGANNS
jgi:head-tail adaptor